MNICHFLFDYLFILNFSFSLSSVLGLIYVQLVIFVLIVKLISVGFYFIFNSINKNVFKGFSFSLMIKNPAFIAILELDSPGLHFLSL